MLLFKSGLWFKAVSLVLNGCLSEQQQQLEWETEGSQIGYCTIYIIQIDEGVRLTSASLFLCVPKHSCTQLSAVPGIAQALIISGFNKLELPCSGTHPAVCCWPCTGGKNPSFDRKTGFPKIFEPQKKNMVQAKRRQYSLYWDVLLWNIL